MDKYFLIIFYSYNLNNIKNIRFLTYINNLKYK